MRLLGVAGIFFIWIFFGALISVVPVAMVEAEPGLPAWFKMASALIGFIPLFLAALFVPLIYRRSVLSGITSRTAFNWNYFYRGIWTWGALILVSGALALALDPSSMKFSFNAAIFIPTLIVGLILLPIQTSAEELYFRSVIPQAISSVLRKPSVVVVASAALFSGMHMWNPEAQESPIQAFMTYFFMAAAWGWAAFKHGGIEVTLGAHLINNISGLFIFGYTGSVIDGVALWTGPAPDMKSAAVSSAMSALIWLGILHFASKRNPD
jgi:membrane protease YdiL (CAAX protease family)